MTGFLWAGCALGALLGFVHGVTVYRRIAPRPAAGRGPGGRLQGLYYGLWTFLLWTLFGAYVLTFWLLGVIAYPFVWAFRRRRAEA